MSVSDDFEVAFVGAAERTDPVVRDIFESGSRVDPVGRITLFGVVNVVTDNATILVHEFSPSVHGYRQSGTGFQIIPMMVLTVFSIPSAASLILPASM